MTIRWGVIGATGFAGKRPLPGLAKAGNCQLHAVLNHNTDAGEVAREFAAAVVYDEQEALLADPDVDAVYICTPVFLHAAHTVAAADAGKHVLVEKPMALTIDECRQMTDACKGNDVKLQIGFMRRFHPYHRKIKEMVDAGVLGRIVRARVQTHLWYPGTPDAWRLKQETGGGGAFMDVGSHCLDLLEFFLGEVQSVTGLTGNVVFDYAVEDTAVVLLRFAAGAIGVIEASFAVPFTDNAIEIHGTEGTLRARRTAGPFTDPELVLTNTDGTTPIAVDNDKDQYQGQFESFAEAIIEDRQPAVDGAAGMRNLARILEIYQVADRCDAHG
ncbi:MAG TPA: hypothetical protein DIT01_22500 [Lentisphaeria bacterium]|nr:hypothetical protein [Lentisphaeria bacterium]|tara:strand:+ start:689 stop:1675 length:987 start_codon:yes stop_codon:yes gene_type:complete